MAGALLVAGGAALVMRRIGAPGDGSAAIVPADAVAYLHVYLRPSLAQRRALRDLLASTGAARTDGQAARLVGGLADAALEGVGLSFERDVQPWVGEQIAGFSVPAGDGPPARALVIAAADRAGARRAAERALERNGRRVARRTIAGRSVSVAGPLAAAVRGDWLLVGDAAAVRAALATRADTSLATRDAFRDATADLEGDRLAFAFLDGGRAAEALPFGPAGASAAVASARRDALVVQVAARGSMALAGALGALSVAGAERPPARARVGLDDGYEPVAYLDRGELTAAADDVAALFVRRGAGREVRAFTEPFSYLVAGTRQEGDTTFVELVLGTEGRA